MTATQAQPNPESFVEKVTTYIKTESHRTVAYLTTEAAALFTLAHVQATTLEHEIAVAGAAAIAALVNKIRVGGVQL